MLTEYVAVFQLWLMRVCLVALSALLVGAILMKLKPYYESIWYDFLHMDKLGKVVVCGGLMLATMYGGSKGFWGKVQEGGADANIGLVGIYTGTSNEVVTVAGVVTTNQIPMVAVMWTNGTVTASTPVSYRASNTNDWTEVAKLNPEILADGSTNILQFVTAQDLHNYPMWWAGVDKPAVIITSSDIDITGYLITSHYVKIDWTCAQPLATQFNIMCKPTTNNNWTTVGTTSANTITIQGFYLDKSLDWKVTSTYLEDGE